MRYLIVISSILFVLSPLFAFEYHPSFSSLRIPVNDMRSKAMGGTEILMSSGSNALFTNPALYSRNKYSCVSVTGLFNVNSSDKYSPDANPTIYPNEFNISNEYPLLKNFKGLSISKGIGLGNSSRLAFGLGYQVAHDLSIKRTLEWYLPNDPYDERRIEKTEFKGDLSTWCPSLSVTLWDMISLGYTIEYSLFDTFKEDVSRKSYYYSDDDVYSYSIINGHHYEGDLSGSCSTIGGVIRFRNINLGVKYRSQFKYDFEDVTYERLYDSDRSGSSNMDDLSMFMPSSYGFSVSVQLNKNLMMVGEYQIHKYSEMNELNDSGTIYDFNDGYVRRFGFETSLLDIIFLRGGLFTEEAFLFDENWKNPEQLKGITGGIGFANGPYRIDFGVEYFQYKYTHHLNPYYYYNDMEGSNLTMGLTISVNTQLI